MFAKWLRDGIRSGRPTTTYPLDRDHLLGEYERWNQVPEVINNCDECEKCRDICSVGAIAFDKNRINIDPGKCICCGVCEAECPGHVFAHGRLDLAIPGGDSYFGSDLAEIQNGIEFRRIFKRSLHVRHIDTGSCNACESDILALTNPYYNFHRLGMFFTASPRHADVLLVTGAVTVAMKDILLETYEAMPKPRIVIASGMCAIDGGPFRNSERFAGRVEDFIPVDVKLPGCPPNPFALINGLLTAVGRKEKEMKK